MLSVETNAGILQAQNLSMEYCAKCNTCSNACHIFEATGGHELYRPTFRAEVLRMIVKKYFDKNGKLIKDLDIAAEKMAAIIKMVDSGDINRMNGRKTLTAVLEEDVDPAAYVKENGFDKKVDTATIEAIMDKVLAENTQALEDFRNGKVKAKQALFGACMRELKGIGDPAVIREMLDKKLS